MPQYLSPGVYIEEPAVGPHPIQGVSTSTTGMVGVTVRGPTEGKPKLVTTFNDYQRIFGGFLPQPDAGLLRQWGSAANLEGGAWWLFPLAVKGFFDNGGQQLYVKRVFSGGDNGATAASGSAVRGLVAEVTKDAAVGATTLVLRHLFGIQVQQGTQLTIVRGDTGQNIGQSRSAPTTARRARSPSAAALAQEVRVARGDVVEIYRTFARRPDQAGHRPGERDRDVPGAGARGLGKRPAGADPADGRGDHEHPAEPDRGAAGGHRAQPGRRGPGRPGRGSRAAGTFDASIDNQTVLIAGHRFQASNPAVNASQLTFTISPAQHATGTVGSGGAAGCARPRLADPSQLGVNGAQKLYRGAIVELDNGTQKEVHTVTAVTGNVVTFDSALTRPTSRGPAPGRRSRGAGPLPADRRPAGRGGLHQPADRGLRTPTSAGTRTACGSRSTPSPSSSPSNRVPPSPPTSRSSRPPVPTAAG